MEEEFDGCVLHRALAAPDATSRLLKNNKEAILLVSVVLYECETVAPPSPENVLPWIPPFHDAENGVTQKASVYTELLRRVHVIFIPNIQDYGSLVEIWSFLTEIDQFIVAINKQRIMKLTRVIHLQFWKNLLRKTQGKLASTTKNIINLDSHGLVMIKILFHFASHVLKALSRPT